MGNWLWYETPHSNELSWRWQPVRTDFWFIFMVLWSVTIAIIHTAMHGALLTLNKGWNGWTWPRLTTAVVCSPAKCYAARRERGRKEAGRKEKCHRSSSSKVTQPTIFALWIRLVCPCPRHCDTQIYINPVNTNTAIYCWGWWLWAMASWRKRATLFTIAHDL